MRRLVSHNMALCSKLMGNVASESPSSRAQCSLGSVNGLVWFGHTREKVWTQSIDLLRDVGRQGSECSSLGSPGGSCFTTFPWPLFQECA